MKTFDEIFIDKTKYGVKVQTSEYGEQGKHIIIDQGQNQIAGYTDREDGLFEEVPVVIFGDHTRVIKYVDEPFFLGADGVKVLRGKDNNANHKYLYYALKNAKIPNTGYNRHFKWLKEVKIKYLDRERQDEIVEILDKVSDAIQKRQDELSQLDDLIKARFVELFGDRYVNDKNWNTTKLGESISFNNGKAHEQVVDENGEYILVTSRAIASDFEDVRRTNTLLFPLHKNDIVMVMSDVPNGKALAKCQLIDSNDKYTLNQRICSFDNYEYNPIFLLHLLNRHPYFLSFNDGNGQTNLRKNDILECELIVPPIELQEQFADFVHQVDKSKVAVQKALVKAQLLFDSLMQKYFG